MALAVRKISDQGQINIPKEIRELLKVEKGERIEFILNVSGEVVIRKASNTEVQCEQSESN